MFSFPENQELRRKWMRAIPRDNWEPTSNSGVCKQHFKPDNLALERTDTNEWRKKKKEPLALIRLKSDAIPTIFPNCLAYLSKEIQNRRSGGATSENRLENYEQIVKEKNNILDEADKVESINDLLLKLDRSLLPDVVLENKTENILIFFTISFEIKPTFSSFVGLKEDLSFTAWRGDVKIPFTKFSHITRSHDIVFSTFVQRTSARKPIQQSTRAKRERICRLQSNPAMPKRLLNCSNNILVQSIIYQLFFHL